jgi:hypothetical protein
MEEQEESASSQRAGPFASFYSSASVNSPTKSVKSFKTSTTTPARSQSRPSVLSPDTGRPVPVIDLTDGM